MELGFSNIISDGQRAANAANLQALPMIGQGVGNIIHGLAQRKYNKELQKLLEEQNEPPADYVNNEDFEKLSAQKEYNEDLRKYLDPTIIGNISPEKKAELDKRMRTSAIIGDVRGLRTISPWLQHEDNLALQREKTQNEQREKMENDLLGGLKQLRYEEDNQMTSLANMLAADPTIGTNSSHPLHSLFKEREKQYYDTRKARAEAEKKVETYKIPDYKYTARNQGTEAPSVNLEENTYDSDMVSNMVNGLLTGDYKIHRESPNLTLNQVKSALQLTKNQNELAKEIMKEYNERNENMQAVFRKQDDAKAAQIEETRKAKEHELGIEAKKEDIETKRKEREKAQQVEDAIVATLYSDLSPDNPEHVAYLAGRDKPFEAKLGLSANSLVGLGIEGIKNLMNDPTKKAEFYAALKRQREEHPKKTQNSETPPATTTEPTKKKFGGNTK